MYQVLVDMVAQIFTEPQFVEIVSMKLAMLARKVYVADSKSISAKQKFSLRIDSWTSCVLL